MSRASSSETAKVRETRAIARRNSSHGAIEAAIAPTLRPARGVVGVRRDPKAKEGDLMVARIGDDLALKGFHRKGETVIELQPVSTHPEHQPIRVEAGGEDFDVARVVVGTMFEARRPWRHPPPTGVAKRRCSTPGCAMRSRSGPST